MRSAEKQIKEAEEGPRTRISRFLFAGTLWKTVFRETKLITLRKSSKKVNF